MHKVINDTAWIYGVIYLVIVLILGLLIIMTTSLSNSKPQYNITIQECHNITESLYPIEATCIQDNKKIDCPTYIISRCEDKEVNEIKYITGLHYEVNGTIARCVYYVENYTLNKYVVVPDKEPDCGEEFKVYNYSTIKKSDLTQKWLDEQLISGFCVCVWDCPIPSRQCPVCHDYRCGKDFKYKITKNG